MNNNVPTIIRGNTFEDDFSFFMGEDFFFKDLREKKYTVKDSGSTYRIINRWTMIGLIDEDRQDVDGWRRFSKNDLVWHRIITALRSFGLSNEKIMNTKASLTQVFKHGNNRQKTTLLELYTIFAMAENKSVQVIVYEDGTANIGTDAEVSLTASWGIFKNYISLDLNALVINRTSRRPRVLDTSLLSLSPDEEKIVRSVRSAEYNKITAVIGEHGQIERIEKSKMVNNNKRLTEVIQEAGYQDVTFKVRDGKVVMTEQKILTK